MGDNAFIRVGLISTGGGWSFAMLKTSRPQCPPQPGQQKSCVTTNVGDNVQNVLGRRKPLSPESREGRYGMRSAGGGIEVFQIGRSSPAPCCRAGNTEYLCCGASTFFFLMSSLWSRRGHRICHENKIQVRTVLLDHRRTGEKKYVSILVGKPRKRERAHHIKVSMIMVS